VHNLQHCKRLRPFRKFAHTTSYIFETDKRNEENDAAKDSGPEDGADEVVGY
jgi:hypothetical protein